MWGNLNRWSASALIMACGVAFAAAAPAAIGQERVMFTSVTAGGPGGGGSVNKKSVERWAAMLGMSEDQKAAALALYDGYRAQYDATQRELSDAMAEARRTFEESQDPSVFAEKMPAVRKKFSDDARRLERSLMEDVKSLLSAEQEQSWVRVERMRRRELGGRFGTVSGDSVDLIEIVDGLKLEPAARAELEEALEQYEVELDRAMQQRIRAMEEMPSFDGGRIDMEAMQKRIAEAREVGIRLKEINQRTARKLDSMLPEQKRGEFDLAVKMQSFPRVYRPTHTARVLEAAGKLGDLDASQREQISELKAQYEREVGSANEALAIATEKDEADPKRGGTLGGAGGSMVVRFGEDNEELAAARKAKRELDERTRKRLSSILRPEQESQLPKPEPEGEMIVPGSGARAIVR